jgi:hypothetical protein
MKQGGAEAGGSERVTENFSVMNRFTILIAAVASCVYQN